ncbi:helix-turn-helix transcriptional regulator [Bradyrhizobium sp.]|uniref:helix-turn-helix transcriptional regulator n=1 Tax=Bradyrhizobium sp. TaxID=376 RepID=UPI0012E7FB8B|nr:AlpA family phage regulatory protein [Bradyrhizobium sp.]
MNRVQGKLAMTAAKQAIGETGIGGVNGFAPRRMLTETQVLDIIPLSRTTLYRMEKAGRFPKCTYISPNRRVWYEDEIVAWQNAVDEFDPRRARGKGRRAGAVR